MYKNLLAVLATLSVGCFEPAMIDKAMHREPPPRLMSPYNDAETVLQVIEAQLAQGPYLLGETMSAADVLWGQNPLAGLLIGFGSILTLWFSGAKRNPI